MKKSSRVAFVLLMAALAGCGWLYRRFQEQRDSAGATAPSVPAPGTRATTTAPSAAASPASPVAGAGAAPKTGASVIKEDFAAEFRDARDYLAFILGTLPAAQAGNANAAYYLARAISYCDDYYRAYFRRGDRVLTVDQAIAEQARLPGIDFASEIRRVDGRCRDVYAVRNPVWGAPDDWMNKAVAAGQPAAGVQMVGDTLLKLGSPGLTGLPKYDAANQIRNVSDARKLVRKSLETKDPRAIFLTGEFIGLLRPDLDSADVGEEWLVWEYAACMRGMDCSSNADWVFDNCLQSPLYCQPGMSGTDLLLGEAARSHWVDFESRAARLLDEIDTQDWAALGLGG